MRAGAMVGAGMRTETMVEAGGPMDWGMAPKGALRPVGVPAGVEPLELKPDEDCGLAPTLPLCCRKLSTGEAGGAGVSTGRGGTTRPHNAGIAARDCRTMGAILQNPADLIRVGHTLSSATKRHTATRNVIMTV